VLPVNVRALTPDDVMIVQAFQDALPINQTTVPTITLLLETSAQGDAQPVPVTIDMLRALAVGPPTEQDPLRWDAATRTWHRRPAPWWRVHLSAMFGEPIEEPEGCQLLVTIRGLHLTWWADDGSDAFLKDALVEAERLTPDTRVYPGPRPMFLSTRTLGHPGA